MLRVIHEGPTAYSCLVALDERTIGVHDERGWRAVRADLVRAVHARLAGAIGATPPVYSLAPAPRPTAYGLTAGQPTAYGAYSLREQPSATARAAYGLQPTCGLQHSESALEKRRKSNLPNRRGPSTAQTGRRACDEDDAAAAPS